MMVHPYTYTGTALSIISDKIISRVSIYNTHKKTTRAFGVIWGLFLILQFPFLSQRVYHTFTHDTSNLNSDFTCEINETFTLKIVQWPESIKLEIFESGLITSSLVSEVYIPIPNPLLTVESGGGGRETYQFSSTKTVEYGHTAVGSGTYVRRATFIHKIWNISIKMQ